MINRCQNRTAIHTRWHAACLAGLLALAGCDTQDQVWSTRGESIIGQPSLNQQLGFDGGPALTVVSFNDGIREAAITLLLEASESESPLIRANALEALHAGPEELEPVVQRGLADENLGVRFIAAMTVGEFRMENLNHLVHPLLDDESDSVRAAAIYALRRNGERVDKSPLARMIVSDNPEVRGNAAMVLGELGNETAIPMLRSAARRGMRRVEEARAKVVDLQIAEAIVRLGEEQELDVIRAALFAPAEQGELAALACLMVGRLGDTRAVSNLVDLATREGRTRNPAEIRMAATLALAQLAPGQVTIAVPMSFASHEHPALRAQAAATLGHIRTEASLQALRQLLHDSNPMVQVTAAGGILRMK